MKKYNQYMAISSRNIALSGLVFVSLFFASTALAQAFPTVDLTVDHTQITRGQSAMLGWYSTNASTCVASNGWSGSRDIPYGIYIINPTVSTTYTITCSNSSGQSATDSVTVTVIEGSNNGQPNNSTSLPYVSLTVSPASLYYAGTSEISWTSSNASYCTASGGWTGNKSLTGSQTVSVYTSSSFTLTCFNSYGQKSDTKSISVYQSSSGNSPLVTLIANPAVINQGSSTIISWNSLNTHSCFASNGWTGSKSLSGSQTVFPRTNTTYTITCTTSNSETTTNSVLVTVNQSNGAVPIVVLNANPTSVTQGQNSQLNWSVTNASTCYASGAWSGTKSTFGTQTVYPSATDSYTLTCINGSNSVSDSETITVIPYSGTINTNPTLTFHASSPIVTSGSPTVLVWNSNNTSSCIAGGGWSGAKLSNGSELVSPERQTNYSLTCYGPNGSVFAEALVSVASSVTEKPAFSVSCNVSDSSVKVGEEVTFSSKASGGRAPYTYVWSGAFSKMGTSNTLPFSKIGTKVATITVSDALGKTTRATCSTNVIQNTVPPPSPLPSGSGEVLTAIGACELKTALVCDDGRIYDVNEGDKFGTSTDNIPVTSTSTSTIGSNDANNKGGRSGLASLFLNDNGRLSGVGLLLVLYVLLLITAFFAVVIYRLLKRNPASREINY